MKNKDHNEYFLYLSKLAKLGFYFPGIIHNLNNPFTSLSGRLQILQRHHPELEKLAEANEYLEQITEQLGKFSALNSQDLHPPALECSIVEVLDQLQFFLLADSTFKHNIKKDIQNSPDYIVAMEPGQFFMVLLHLFQNALDAVLEKNADDGELRLIYEKKESEIVFTLSDNGIGIPDYLQDKIFEAGFTTKDSDDEQYKYPRLGYGMTLTSNILKRCGGTVYLLPSMADEWTRINFAVPAQD